MSTSNGNGKQSLLEDDDESPLDQADDQLSLQDGDSGHVHSSEVHSGDAKVDTPGGGSANGHTERTSSAGGNGKIFIGGLSWDTTTEKLENYFRKYGEITDAVIMRDRGSGTPRGFGFVTFADPGLCESVLQDKHVLDGRTVECKRSIPRENMGVVKGPKTKKIFVGGIPPSISEEEFRDYFSSFGTVVEHQIMQDHNTGRSRGFGFIVFDSEQTVEDVLAHGRMHELGGKQVEIKKAEPKKAMQDSASAYYGPSRSSYGSSSGPYGYADYLLGGSAYGGISYRGGGYGSRMYTHGSYGVGYGGYGGYGAGIGVGGYGVGSLGGGYLGSYSGGGYMLGGYADDGYSGMGYGGGGGGGGYGSSYGYGSSGSYGGGGGGGSGGAGGYGHSSGSSRGHSHSHSHGHGHSHGGSNSAGRYHPYSRY